VQRSVEDVLADHAELTAKRHAFLEQAAVVVAAATVPQEVVAQLIPPAASSTGINSFLSRVDQVLRDAGR
jgi:hypothetical protein